VNSTRHARVRAPRFFDPVNRPEFPGPFRRESPLAGKFRSAPEKLHNGKDHESRQPALTRCPCLGRPSPQARALLYATTSPRRTAEPSPPYRQRTIGAMIFGDARHEHIQLNEISLWTGDEKDTGSYQNLGDLLLDLTHGGAPKATNGSLNIGHRAHSIAYNADGIACARVFRQCAPTGFGISLHCR